MSRDFSESDISQSLGIHISTVYRYVKSYSTVGLSDFLSTNYDGFWGNLSSVEISILRTELKRTVYTDSKSIAAWIEDRFGVHYKPASVVDLLNRIGFTYKKTKEIPCECDIEKQKAFVSELAEVFENIDKETVVYYADGWDVKNITVFCNNFVPLFYLIQFFQQIRFYRHSFFSTPLPSLC
ncbi:MAG: winged helix-turn-helix domain-containing protein [Bacteroidales bacterium]|nr:winged helix-turn-helix domain-containing protein [Bacteroidales bacterium]